MSKVEQIGFYEIPNDPRVRQLLIDTVENARQALVRIEAEQEFIKEALKEASQASGIKVSDLRKLATDRAKGSFSKTVETSEKYQDLYESLYNPKKETPVE